MVKLWVRKSGTATTTTAATQVSVTSIYQNSRESSGNITHIQKVTVVAAHLFAVTNTEDVFSMRLIVADEGRTISYGEPEVADPEIKGMYIFARGPVYFSPRRLISIPVESELSVQIRKEMGANASVNSWYGQFLLNITN